MRKLVVPILAAMIATPAAAVPTVATLDDFTGATVIDSAVPSETEITNQFAAQGIGFSGGLFGAFLLGPPLLPSAALPYSANTDDFLCRGMCPPGNDITVTFSNPQTRFGFFAVTNADDDLMLTLFSGATNLGSLSYGTSLTELFVGIAESGGFNRVLIQATGAALHVFAADGYRFDGLPPSVPEPAAIGLLGMGLLGLGWVSHRTSR